MGNLRKVVGVGLAVALVAALAVYVLVPKTGPTTNSVVVNQPQTPTSPGSGGTTGGGSGSGGSGGSGSGSPPPTTPPSSRPPKAHGQNSHGPNHMICLPEKDHPGNGVSQYQGANQYRGQCPAGAAQGSLSHGHAATTWAVDAVTADALVYVVTTGGIHGIE